MFTKHQNMTFAARISTLCRVCQSRLVAIVAVGFAAHWVFELIAIAMIARLACQ